MCKEPENLVAVGVHRVDPANGYCYTCQTKHHRDEGTGVISIDDVPCRGCGGTHDVFITPKGGIFIIEGEMVVYLEVHQQAAVSVITV